MKIYSLFDKKAMNYGPVMAFPNDVTAIRAIEMDMVSSKSVVASYPHDFALMCLGEYDDSTGALSAFPCPSNIYECASYFAKE